MLLWDGIMTIHSSNAGTISNNVMKDTQRNGIRLSDDLYYETDGSNNILITGNEFIGNFSTGVLLERQSHEIIVSNNLFNFDDERYGIVVSGFNSSQTVYNNFLLGNMFISVGSVTSRYIIDINNINTYNTSVTNNYFDKALGGAHNYCNQSLWGPHNYWIYSISCSHTILPKCT